MTSPPYNLQKKYGATREPRRSLEEYLGETLPVVEELYRILGPRGNFCWQVGNYVEDGEVFPLDIYFYEMLKRLGLILRNRIVWHFESGLHATKRFSGRYETILWFSKTDDYVFDLDAVRVPAKYPGKKHFKGSRRGQLSCNPFGKNPSDYWDVGSVLRQDWEELVWSIPNVKANHPEKTIHPCQFPIELIQRLVLALTREGDYVLDPFGGVGSSMIAAVSLGRNAIMCEIEAQYIETARQRLDDYRNGTLRIRPLGKPIYEPTEVRSRPSSLDVSRQAGSFVNGS
ncbi:MAG: site-specific DNA-methyltransferase [Desulfomonilaceae bacterium]